MSTACTLDTPPAVLTTSDRIQRLIRQVLTRRRGTVHPQNPFLRDLALYRAIKPERSPAMVRAAMLVELAEILPIVFPPDWTLAGEHGSHGHSRPQEQNQAAAALTSLGLPEAEVPKVRPTLDAWSSRCGQAGSRDLLPSEGVALWQDNKLSTVSVYAAHGWMENHSIRDYALLLRIGYRGLIERIEAVQAAADLTDPTQVRAWATWASLRLVAQAGIRLAERYAQGAREAAAKAQDEDEARRLRTMADTLAQVPAHPARTLHEAVQALWMGHLLTCLEDGINANSIGRLDCILEPYYQADLAAGRIDHAGAVDLMAELAAKLYLEYDVQAITLGGTDAAGRDASGAMSLIILEATAQVGWSRDLSLRWHPGTPPELLRAAAALVAKGGGIPFFFNDTSFVPALTDRGVALEHARDYAPIGCVELTIPGKANPRAVSGWFSLPKCLELALFDGCDPASGARLGPATGHLHQHADFAALLAAYDTQVEFFARRMILHCNHGEARQRDLGPLPAWSLLTDDCIARGRDITDGGALYDFHSICLCGVPDTADALFAIRQLVYEERSVSAQALVDALRADWQGHEALRRRCLDCAKYGNDQTSVDELAARLAHHFIDLMDQARSCQNGRYIVHLFSFYWNMHFGRGVGALPDGRRAGEPLAYSLSAHQGRDRKGVTALLNSLTRMPHHRAAGGSAAIIEIDPRLVEGPRGADLLATLVTTAFGQGVGQLQWNVVRAERLREAQRDPERLGHLAVRVAGYSQQFRLIPADLQEHIIARTKHER